MVRRWPVRTGMKQRQNPGTAQLTAVDDFLFLAGGVPIQAGIEMISAVGIGGAPPLASEIVLAVAVWHYAESNTIIASLKTDFYLWSRLSLAISYS